MKKGSWWRFRRGICILPVVAASMVLAATATGASAASVTPYASTQSLIQQQGRNPFAFHPTGHLQGTLRGQAKVKGFDPEGTAFTLSSKTKIETCHNVMVRPKNTTLPQGKFSEYRTPAGWNGDQSEILKGADTGMWYAFEGERIVRVSHKGQFTTCAIPTPGENVNFLTNGPDGAIWFTEASTNKIGRLQILKTRGSKATARVTEFSGGLSEPEGITVGPDNQLWFTEYAGNKIDMMAINGSGVSYSLPTANAGPLALTAGPDGAVWFTENVAGQIGRITTLGFVSEFSGFMSHPFDIVNGPNHKLWYTDPGDDAIGNISTDGATSVFGGLMTGANPIFITNCNKHKSLAFTEDNGVIGLITKAGIVSEIGIPHATSIYGISNGWDNSLWITEDDVPTMGKFTFK